MIGKSTRSDVFGLLGTPHSIFQGQVEFEEAEGLGTHPHQFYSYKTNRYLSSLDEQHYALLYRFQRLSGHSLVVAPVVVVYGNTDVVIRSDDLFILLDKDTNIVADVAYRQETGQ